MQLLLQDGEEIVRSWNYGKSREGGVGGDQVEMRMTVTNKRVVNTIDGTKSFSQSEAPIDKIKSVSGFCGKQNSTGLLILGAICCLSMVLLIVGVIILIVQSNAGSKIELNIDLEGESSEGISISSSSSNYKKKKKKTKVRVDFEAARQMIAELGTVVRTLQAKA